MHEYNVTEEIVNIVLEKAKEHESTRVGKINIILGKLAGFSSESIDFYFSFLSKNTPAEDARLNFKEKGIVFKCRTCSEEFEEDDMIFSCPGCRGESLEIISGNEFFVESIEVEDGKD